MEDLIESVHGDVQVTPSKLPEQLMPVHLPRQHHQR
jgi:hypothetical protein